MEYEDSHSLLKAGTDAIRSYAQKLPDTPGVYRMVGANGEVLYVGKAKMLKRRVMSYTHVAKLSLRLKRMVALTQKMEFVHTHTEVEALLLEANLIKKLKPRFNILLRDDKSFPYILITGDHDYAQITKHRGARKRKGKYFGPFPSAGAVNRTIATMQRAFMIRNCTDGNFANRDRPCLQYHIKRCTAPCVGYVSEKEYAQQIKEVHDFFHGASNRIKENFAEKMYQASEDMDFETAAQYRDKLRALSSVQSSQDINIEGLKDADVMALEQLEGKTCIQVFFFRAGQNLGNYCYYPRHQPEEKPEDILGAFIAQFYENKPVPAEVLVSHDATDKNLIEEALEIKAKRKVTLLNPKRGAKTRGIEFAKKNARRSLERYLLQKSTHKSMLQKVGQLFDLEETPRRIEVYDNSHIAGTNMVGAMIVADENGFNKNAYRKFNIKMAKASDDFGMMREVIERRFKRALKEEQEGDNTNWPDLLLIDGGLGQYNAVKDTLEECGVFDKVAMVAISKGPDRNAGREKFHTQAGSGFQLPENDPALHFLQRLRDEAHRFAIGAHRQKRQKAISRSSLDDIPGIGAKRKKELLSYFGSSKAVMEAGIADLENVPGISQSVAEKIYNFFHEQE